MQPLAGKAAIRPGRQADFTILVWLTTGTRDSLTARLSVTPRKLAARFTGCHVPRPATCRGHGTTTYSLERLAAGHIVYLRARIAVPTHTRATRVRLRVRATSPQSRHSASAVTAVAIRPAPTATPTPGGVGATLPAGLPPPNLPTPPVASLPPLPSALSDPGAAFPVLSPTASPSPAALPSALARPIRMTDISAAVPLDMRLLGGQIVGLAALALAVATAVARMTARGRRGRDHDRHGGTSG